MRRRLGAFLAAALSAVASTAPAQTFDFETTPMGTTVPFSITSGGLTATFTSAANFSVMPSPFSTLHGNALFDDDDAVGPLTITFSRPLAAISLGFGTNSPFAPAGLTLQAFDGATLVGTVGAPGVVPPGFLFPEGSIAFAGGPLFTSVVLSSAARDFAIDDLVVSAIPEPAALALLGPGVLLVAAVAARRRRPLG
jgi:hypothetical protein